MNVLGALSCPLVGSRVGVGYRGKWPMILPPQGGSLLSQATPPHIPESNGRKILMVLVGIPVLIIALLALMALGDRLNPPEPEQVAVAAPAHATIATGV